MYIEPEECCRLAGHRFTGAVHVGADEAQERELYERAGFQRVIWIEANPYRLGLLKANLRPRRLQLCQHELYDACLSDGRYRVPLYLAGGSTSLLPMGTHTELYPRITVEQVVQIVTQRFDSLVLTRGINLDGIDFLNIDVQGTELDVLKGCGLLLQRFAGVYVEVNFEQVYRGCCEVEQIDSYLRGHGYRNLKTVAPERAWGDALYVRTPN